VGLGVCTGTLHIGDPQTLQRLSQDGGEALSLTYTQTINTFLYARDAKLVSGFDLTVPSIRYGLDEHHFDTVIANAGFNADQPPEPAAGALFIHDLFGIDLDQQMLEGPDLSSKLRE
jgi:hypothetical protein